MFVPPKESTSFMRGFFGQAFFGVRDHPACNDAFNRLFNSLEWFGRFASDNMVLWGRSLSFLDDPEFAQAYRRHAQTPIEKGIVWRTHTVTWAARRALALDGDLVECGTYKGVTARIVADLLRDRIGERQFWLYDAFEWSEDNANHSLPDLGDGLLEQVRERFADADFVRIVPGYIPDSFEQGAPEKVSFLHIDLNNEPAESAALAFFWDRLTPGATVLFDDFGWYGYMEQRLAHEAFAREHGHHILELPTGQGMLIKAP